MTSINPGTTESAGHRRLLRRWMPLLRRHAANRRSLWLLLAALLFCWNTILLWLGNVSPDTQVLNLLLWLGCMISLEDRIQELWPKPSRASFIAGAVLVTITLLRGDWTTTGEDRFFYLFLPLAVTALSLLSRPIGHLRMFLVPILISLLLPLSRVLFAAHPLFTPTITTLAWINLSILGFSPHIEIPFVYLQNASVEVGGNCTGIDQIIFTLCVALIFLMVFPLRRWLHRLLVIGLAIATALFVNVQRISLLAWLVNLPEDRGKGAFKFFHDSAGGLVFSLVSVSIVGWVYLALIHRELA